MNRRQSWLSSGVGAFAIAIGTLSAAPASAQSGQAASSDATTQSNEPATDIVVTGSRIARPELESAMPISITNMDDAFALGDVSATEALSLDPSIGNGVDLSSDANARDSGIQAVDLRNLGSNRSLTLVDGQRRVSASAASSAVDLGMIPVGMIDRIEIVTGGAAAIYGADAVTGAVNIITKRHIKGFHLSATNGISGQGDASKALVSFSTGAEFAGGRGSFSLGGTYAHISPLYYTDRHDPGYFLHYTTNPANTGIGDGIPDVIRLEHYHQIYYDYRPNFYYGGQSYLIDNGVLRPAVYDTTFSGGEFSKGDGGDGRVLIDTDMFRGRKDSLAFMGRYDYDIFDNVRYGGYFSFADQKYLGGEGDNSFHRDDSRTVWFDGAGGSVAYLDNPYLPDSLRQFMVANGLTTLKIDRTYGNFPKRNNHHSRQSYTIGQTLDGDLTSTLKWNAFWQYGRTRDKAIEGPVPWKDHWLAARDVIADPVSGDPVCRDPSARADGCIPLNIFSLEAPSKELLKYVMASRHARRTNSQQIFGGSISGALFKLPYGDLSVAAGIERRIEKLHTTDDPLALSGQIVYGGGLSAQPELDVSSSVTEEYGEIVVPLVKHVPFLERLEFEGAFRHSDYSRFGSTNTWKLGGTWSPISGVTFRGVRSRSIRAPNFGELFTPQFTVIHGSISDPCEIGGYYANPNRAKNCAALGITTPLGDLKEGPAVTTGGNPNLKPETSNSLTLGVVLQPKVLPGFDVTVDYYKIDIRNVITEFSYTTLLNLCVDLPTIDNPYCARIARDPVTHGPVTIRSNELNAARLYTSGIDAGINYRHRLGAGQLHLSFKGSYLFDRVTETTPGDPTGDVVADGNYLNPRFRATLLTGYSIGKFSALIATRFMSASTYDLKQIDNPEAYPTNYVPPTLYNDVSMQYRVNEHYRIGFGVKNVTDKKPPLLPATIVNSTMYDLVGRYFYVTAKADF
jgi:outer membrane receptor protein involved in Fe transport